MKVLGIVGRLVNEYTHDRHPTLLESANRDCAIKRIVNNIIIE